MPKTTDFSRLQNYASKKRYILYILCQITVRALALVVPYLTELLIDSVSDNDLHILLRYSLTLISTIVIYVILLSLTFYVKVCYEDATIAIKKKEIIDRMLQIPLANIQEKGSGFYIQRFSSTVENCRSFLIDKPVNFYLNIIYGFGIMISMFRIDIMYTLLLLVIFPVLAHFYRFLANKVSIITAESEDLSDKGNSLVEETYLCNYTIRTNNAEKWIQGRAKSILVSAFMKDREYNRIETVYDYFLITGLMNIMTIMVYILGGYFVLKKTVTYGMVVSMSLLFSKLWTPLEFYLDYPKQRAKYLAHKQRLDELLAGKDILSTNKIELGPFKRLDMKELTYANGDNILFNHLSLELMAGEHIAIYGSNGSGKSTLANLIASINHDYSGWIFYNNTDYRSLNPHDIREHICLIPAKAELFTGTIKENVLLGTEKEIPCAVLDLLNKKGLQLDFELQENGSNLSSGESKLVQLARGFCRDSDVYIIDEPLNFIDEDYAEMIISALDTLCVNKTVIVISHDQRVFRSCSRYYHLNNCVLTETDGFDSNK